MLRHASPWAPEGGTSSCQFCGNFTACRFGNESSSSWQSWCLKSWMALCHRISLPACQHHQLVFQCPNMCATKYHCTSGRSGFCCCRTAIVEQPPSKTATTWPLSRTIPSAAKDAFVVLMAATPCDFVLWCRVQMCLLTFLTYLPHNP